MDKSHPLCTPMVVRLLDVDKGSFRPQENDEELLGPKVPYLRVIGTLMYCKFVKQDIVLHLQ